MKKRIDEILSWVTILIVQVQDTFFKAKFLKIF